MNIQTVFASASILALAIAFPAKAQEAPAATVADNADEIVVTAQRRTENLRDVPIAITVVSGDAMIRSGATQLADIQQFTPSLKFAPVPGTPNFSIRGIGTNSFDYGIESAVGLAIDDVNLTLPRYIPVSTLADIERVEVLRGPQGLLFGKNTTAGLISVTTRRPQLGEFTNSGRVQYGSRDQLQVHNILNVPLGDTVAVRVRAAYQTQDPTPEVRGPGRIAQTRNYNFNGKLLWEPSDRFSLYAIADYQQTQGDPGVWTIRQFGAGATAPAVGNTFVRVENGKLGIVPGPRNNATAIGAYNYNKTRSGGAQLSMNYDLGAAVVTSVTAYRDVNQEANLEVDSSPRRVYDTNYSSLEGRQFSQELRVASSGSRVFDYVAGLYYWNQRLKAVNLQHGTFGYLPDSSPVEISSPGGQVDYRVRNESYAAFAQGTVNIGELQLFAGARYTHDSINNTTGVSAVPNICAFAYIATGGALCQTQVLPFARSAQRKEGGWSLRAGAEYAIAPAANVYFSYSRGYKGPAISSINANIYGVNPEIVDAYEFGLKADMFDRRLTINLALFQNDFRDFQAQVFDPTVPPQGTFRSGNAGALRTRGVEVEMVARPATGFVLSTGVTFLDTEFSDYLVPCFVGQTVAQGCVVGPTGASLFDAAGLPLPGASKWTTSVAAGYQTPISSNAKVFFNTDWSYRSSTNMGLGNPKTAQRGYSIVNATIGLAEINDRFRVSVFARNLFDQRYAAFIFPGYFDAGQAAQILPDNAFRRVGVALDWNF